MTSPYFRIIALCLICVGCGLFDHESDLAVVTEVAPSAFSAGDSVAVRIVVTNRSEELQTITINTCPEPFSVLDRQGTVVGPASGVCTLELRQRTLQPGESYTFERHWGGSGRTVTGKGMLPPGTYRIRGYPVAEAEGRAAPVTIQ